MNFKVCWVLVALPFGGFLSADCAAAGYEASNLIPPKPLREFRGVWVATLANIDWPSKPGLPTADQKQELITILDRAAQLKLNAVMFQVRTVSDAVYASQIEPWSEYLTGTMGRAPEPFYDPLAFAVEQAHARGLELHAWFNPFRAGHPEAKSPPAPNHIARTHPELVHHYGKQTILDPGEPETQKRALEAMLEVVKRYDVDGLVIDDYFYPYPEKNSAGQEMDFSDGTSWNKYGVKSGLNRADWRRENVNRFVQKLSLSIKAAKPWVKFGISPFGIWRPGYPPQIKGFDAYAKIYADARKWLVNGWMDYLAPQLYWAIETNAQSFPALLNWWTQQNPKGREIFSGIAASSAGKWKPEEIPNQIRITRKQNGADGYILYSMKSLLNNPPLFQKLEHDLNAEPALVPGLASRAGALPEPKVRINGVTNLRLWLSCPTTNKGPMTWVLQTKSGGKWKTELAHGQHISRTVTGVLPEAIAVTQVDRVGNASKPVVFERKN